MKSLKKVAVMFIIMLFSVLNINAYAATNEALKN